MSNEKVPLVAPTVGGLKEQHKKKEGKGYLAYGVIATALCMGFVANSQAGIFNATPQPEVNLLRSSSTSGCEDFCEDDRSDKHPGGAHSDSTLCAPGDMAYLCGGCDFCQPTKDDCQGFCEDDRGTHTDSQLCGTGFMADQCGGCEFCQPKDDTSPCEVTCKEHNVHQDYKCSDTRSTMVCYPSSGGDYPVVLYQRGSGGWDGGGDKSFITSMAEQCLIVIAPMTSGDNKRKASCQTNEDLITAYHDAQDNWKAAWNIQAVTPNWDRIGAAGHSAGAHHLPTFQMLFYKKYTKRINAVMFSHGGSPDDKTSKEHYKPDLNNCLTWNNATAGDGKSICAGVPAFFLTAPKDNVVYPEWTKNWYTKLTKVVKHVVYVEANSAYYGHDEPTHLRKSGGYGILNAYTGRFLACHLYESGTTKSEACDYIYGNSSSKAICSYKSTVKGTCMVSQP